MEAPKVGTIVDEADTKASSAMTPASAAGLYGLSRLPPLTLALNVPEDLRDQSVANYCLGLGEEKAYLAAGLTDTEIEYLYNDKAWKRLLDAKRAQAAALKAGQLDRLSNDNMKRGISKELIRILEVIDPEDFSPRATVSVAGFDIPEPEVKLR